MINPVPHKAFYCLVTLTALLFSQPAISQSNINFGVETTSSEYTVIQSIALSGNRIAVLGWDDGAVNLFFSVFDASGTRTVNENINSQINWPHTTHGATAFNAVAMDNGNIFIAYYATSNATGIQTNNARYVVIDENGVAQASGQLNSTDAGLQVTGNMLIDKLSDGKIVVVWRRTTNENIVFRLFNADGTPFANDQPFAGAGTGTPLSTIYTVKLGAGKSGSFMISLFSWNSYMRGFIFNNDGTTALSGGALSFAIDATLINNYGNCGVAGLSNGNYAVAWFLSGTSYLKIVAPDGSTVVNSQSLSYNPSDIFSVYTSGSEGFIMTEYTHQDADDPENPYSSYLLHRYNQSGVLQSSDPLAEGFLIQPTYNYITGNGGGFAYTYSYYKNYTIDMMMGGYMIDGDKDTRATTVGFVMGTLPVKLLSYTATLQPGGQVRLSWSTASENNSHYFDIEKSSDGVHFTAIGRVSAAGTTSLASYYDFTDPDVVIAKTYYRLKQVDIDGKADVMSIKTIIPGKAADKISVYPNPVTGAVITIRTGGGTLPFNWQLTDINGRLLKSGKLLQAQQQIDVHDISDGIYFLRVGNNPVIKIKK